MARSKRAAKKRAAKKKAAAKPSAAQVQRLRRELKRTRGELELRTEELEAAEARSEALQERLLEIQGSRPYRVASRLWRIRARARAPLSGRSRHAQEDATEAAEPDAGPEGPADAAAGEAAAPAEAADAPAEASERDFEQEFHGSRGVRVTDSEGIGPLRAVLLLGGQTEDQLREALDGLDGKSSRGAEPLIVTDCDALRTLDASGYLYEYIPPREDWTQRLGLDNAGYDEFLRRRLHSIAGMYGLTDMPLEGLERPR
jgi:hypothetical protein